MRKSRRGLFYSAMSSPRSRDMATREHMLRAVEKACAPYIRGFDEALHASMAGVLAGMRKGKA